MSSHMDFTSPDQMRRRLFRTSLPPRERAEAAIEWLARFDRSTDAEAWAKAQIVLMSLLNDYDDLNAETRYWLRGTASTGDT